MNVDTREVRFTLCSALDAKKIIGVVACIVWHGNTSSVVVLVVYRSKWRSVDGLVKHGTLVLAIRSLTLVIKLMRLSKGVVNGCHSLIKRIQRVVVQGQMLVLVWVILLLHEKLWHVLRCLLLINLLHVLRVHFLFVLVGVWCILVHGKLWIASLHQWIWILLSSRHWKWWSKLVATEVTLRSTVGVVEGNLAESTRRLITLHLYFQKF
jgi:hypothetical protein